VSGSSSEPDPADTGTMKRYTIKTHSGKLETWTNDYRRACQYAADYRARGHTDVLIVDNATGELVEDPGT
jgi:hypothetical protein